MINHRLESTKCSSVQCLRCKKNFVPPSVTHDIWDRIHCMACNYKEVGESLRNIEELEKNYSKAPLKRQRRQGYRAISKTF